MRGFASTFGHVQLGPIGSSIALDRRVIQPGGRLTLTSGTPVTTSDVTGATSIYYTPFTHPFVPAWDGAQIRVVTFAELTIALGTLSSDKPYDLFYTLSGNTIAFDSPLAWTNDTTRATAVSWQNGLLSKSGDPTRHLAGSFYTTSTTQTADAVNHRYLSNLYNAHPRSMNNTAETTNTWNYSTNSFRQANANTANELRFMVTYPQHAVEAVAMSIAQGSSTIGAASGVGLDSTTVNSAFIQGAHAPAAVGSGIHAYYQAVVAAGRHRLCWLENAGASTVTWWGDAGTTYIQAGIVGTVWN